MQVGYRITAYGMQGVLVDVKYPLTPSYREVQVLWDDNTKSWEMGTDVKRVPNIPGDSFRTSGNGFGVIAGESIGCNPIQAFRDKVAGNTDAELTLRYAFGLTPRPRDKPMVSKDRQLTIDIHRRVLHGAPVKGGGGSKAGKQQLALAARIATGVPLCAAEEKLNVGTTLARVKTRLGWAARAAKLGPKKMIRRHSKW